MEDYRMPSSHHWHIEIKCDAAVCKFLGVILSAVDDWLVLYIVYSLSLPSYHNTTQNHTCYIHHKHDPIYF